MQKFDFDKWYNNEFKEKQPDWVKSSNVIVKDNMLQTAKACSEHYEEQIKKKLAAIDAEIEFQTNELNFLENENKKDSHEIYGQKVVVNTLQKARGIVAGEGEE